MNTLFFLKNKVIKNASWIIFGRLVNMICAFFVSVLTAQYLGPSNFGLVNYGIAYTAFFYSLCTLGINSILVKALIDENTREGEILGSTIVLQIISSILSALTIICIVGIVDRDKTTIVVVALCSIGLPFRVFHCIMYWFQAHLVSKYSAIATTVGYLLISFFRVVLLIRGASVCWFATANALDYLIISIVLLFFYFRCKGHFFTFSINRSKELLKMGAPFILAGLMVSIYGQTDKIMLKQMLNSESVGYYSVAVSLANAWAFILSAIIDSLIPIIMEAHKTDYKKYERFNRILYFIVFYISIFVSLLFLVFSKPVIMLLYGNVYLPAVLPLQIVSWYVAFSYLGVARDAWIISEKLQKYVFPIYAGAVAINVVLNFILIPPLGASGAALASLLTQISTIFFVPLAIQPMHKNIKLLMDAIFFKDLKYVLSFIRKNDYDI